MNFVFNEQEESLRDELRSYLSQHLPKDWAGLFVDKEEAWDESLDFCKAFAKNGWLTMAWPVEYGGKGASEWDQAVVREELWSADEPRGPQYMNLNWIGPAIRMYGTEHQRMSLLPPISRGEVTWCQGFSEPNAGSDLASLETQAVEDGDYYVINGQKIWTSYSGRANMCFLLARTDPEAQKHRGISVFLVDMQTPGITVRSMNGLHGPHHFNEVFWDDVRVHRDTMLGNKNEGWSVVIAALAFERIGVARYARNQKVLDELKNYAKEHSRNGKTLAEDAVIRQRFSELETNIRVAQLLNYRVVSMVAAGLVPNAEGSLARVKNIETAREVATFGMDLMGLEGEFTLDADHAPLRGQMEYYYGEALAGGVAAGTLEVQRNLIAERGLGLPRAR